MTKHARYSLLPSFIIISAVLLAGCKEKEETQAVHAEPHVTVHVVKSA
ncbi:efflux transporter periplasmic adaptor subunit, partial [Escherichia coli]